MAVKNITYKEPKSYFNKEMQKAARDFEKQEKAAAKNNGNGDKATPKKK